MKTTIPLTVIKIQKGLHLGMHALINQKDSFLILDTGASQTVFDKKEILKFVEKENIKKNKLLSSGLGVKDMKSEMIQISEFSLGKIKLRRFKAMILDLSHVNKTYHELGLPQIDGVIGSDLLMKLKAKINFENRTLTLTK